MHKRAQDYFFGSRGQIIFVIASIVDRRKARKKFGIEDDASNSANVGDTGISRIKWVL